MALDPRTMMMMFGGLQQMGGTPLQQATGIGVPGQTAPMAPNPGGLGGQGGMPGLLGSGTPAWDKYMQQNNPQPVQQAAAMPPVGQQGGMPAGRVTEQPSVFNGDPTITPQGPDPMSGFGGFFDNLDQNFQSPSKQMGLGLLGQIHPAAPYAGLLAGGLFGPNKVF